MHLVDSSDPSPFLPDVTTLESETGFARAWASLEKGPYPGAALAVDADGRILDEASRQLRRIPEILSPTSAANERE